MGRRATSKTEQTLVPDRAGKWLAWSSTPTPTAPHPGGTHSSDACLRAELGTNTDRLPAPNSGAGRARPGLTGCLLFMNFGLMIGPRRSTGRDRDRGRSSCNSRPVMGLWERAPTWPQSRKPTSSRTLRGVPERDALSTGRVLCTTVVPASNTLSAHKISVGR